MSASLLDLAKLYLFPGPITSVVYARDPAPPVRDEGGSLSKWLPWVIGLAALLLLFSWMRGCGEAPATGAMTDSTQMMAPSADTAMPAAPVVAETVHTADTVRVRAADTVHVVTADTVMVPTAPADTVPKGAMGGQGKPGKKAPPKPAP